MMAVIPFLGFWFARKNTKKTGGRKIQVGKYIPLFVLGYVLMGLVRTAGDGLFGSGGQWVAAHNLIRQSAEYIIAVAIACVGLNTHAKRLTKLGYRPFLGGLAASVALGAVSWLLVTLFGSYLKF